MTNKNNESLHFYQQVTAHTLGRTAITNLLLMGVEEQAVRKLSRHAPNSKEFYKYVILADDLASTQIRNAQALLTLP